MPERPVEGKVVEAMPNALFRVELPNGEQVVAHVGGSLRLHLVRLLPGERVRVERSPIDPSRGRIVGKTQADI